GTRPARRPRLVGARHCARGCVQRVPLPKPARRTLAMSLLHARGLSLRYGPKISRDEAGFALGHHDRVGLIGPNGSGKSTLMKILAGKAEPDSGSVQLVRKARAGYLPQELSELPDGSLIDGVLSSVPGRVYLEQRLISAETALS